MFRQLSKQISRQERWKVAASGQTETGSYWLVAPAWFLIKNRLVYKSHPFK